MTDDRDSNAELSLGELRNIWQVAWIVAGRRLREPLQRDVLEGPATNVADALEAVTEELIRRCERYETIIDNGVIKP